MCLIVDANVAREVFGSSVSTDGYPVRNWLDKHAGRMVFGGKLATELFRHEASRRWLREGIKAGRAERFADDIIEREELSLREADFCVSNDLHVIALAKVSGARVVFTRDKDLQKDVNNARVISAPRGKVYSSASHTNLLKYARCQLTAV